MATIRPSRHDGHALSVEATAEALGVSLSGLSSEEAARRLVTYGPNSFEIRAGNPAPAIMLRQFRSPLVLVLIMALAVVLAIGDFQDAIAIGVVVTVNTIVGFIQEYRAEHAVRALQELATPGAVVIRDGQQRAMDGRDVVPGDLVVLTAGARVPADIRLVTAVRLRVDESLLTGESTPVGKTTVAVELRQAPLPDRTTMAFSGTTVVAGRGAGLAVATGLATELGAIASLLEVRKPDPLPLERRLSTLGRWIAAGVGVASAIVFAVGVATGNEWSEMFLVAVAMAVAAIPEGLPVAVTVALVVGVRRMAVRKAVVRRLAAVETLGSCSVIVSDKTGTLTQNRMTVERVIAHDEARPHALAAGVLCSEATLYEEATPNEAKKGGAVAGGDPTESALLIAAAAASIRSEDLLARNPRVAAVPFDPASAYSASIHEGRAGQPSVYVVGAPEKVVDMCDCALRAAGRPALDRAATLRQAHEMASSGMRVLAMAVGFGQTAKEPALGGMPRGLAFAGLQGMRDPPRPEAAQAVAACREAGIRVVMVTGDHAGTASAIARSVELVDAHDDQVIEGAAIDQMDDLTLARAARQTAVFARVSPAQKLRIVEVLKRNGDVVAVTGDGVNDAPALKTAHLGLAMGQRGTDAAREASDIVLADDNFATVYAAVEEGRTAFANIRNVTYFLLVTAVGEVLTVLGSMVLRMPLPLLPIHLLWLNVVTEGAQDVALAAEKGDPELLARPPRRRTEGVLSRLLTERLLLVGVLQGTVALSVFAWQLGAGLEYARSAVLTVMVLTQVLLAGSSRSERASVFSKSPVSNPWLFWGVSAALALHVALMYTPWGRELFRLAPLSAGMWPTLLAIALSVLVAAELHKVLRRPATTEP